MRVLIFRHGMTEWNEEKRYQGHWDLPLSEKGKALLQRADFSPETVFVSPLLRARQTAEILFPEAKLIPVEGLKEMSFGTFEGRGYWEMEDDPDYRKWVEGGCMDACPQGSENRDTFTERVCRSFEALMESNADESLVIVAHGGTQMAIGSRYGRPEREYFSWQTPTGEALILDAAHWEQERFLTLL